MVDAERLGDGYHVLVAAAAEVDDDVLARAEALGHLDGEGDGVRGLERGDDPFGPRELRERGERLVVRDGLVDRAAAVLEERVLGADARVVEARGDGVRRLDLARHLVLEQVRPRAVQHAGRAARERRGALRRVAVGLGAVHRDAVVAHERVEHADRVRAAADARDDGVGQAPAVLLHELLPRLGADDGLQVADDGRERVRSDRRADEVVRVSHVRDPVPHGLVDRVLERGLARADGHALAAEHVHAKHVERLPRAVDRAHVDDALQPEQRADRRRRDAVLARARLRDDARLAEALREQRLADGVVDLVRAGVRELLPLQPDGRAAHGLREALRLVQRRRAADELLPVERELLPEGGVRHRGLVLLLQLRVRRRERLRDVAAAERAEVVRHRGLFKASGLGRVQRGRARPRGTRGGAELPDERRELGAADLGRIGGGGVERPDDGRAHDDAVREGRKVRDVRRRRDAEAHGRRHVARGRAHALHERLEVVDVGRRAARHARHGHAVEHAAARLPGRVGEVRHALVRRRRRHQRHVPQRAAGRLGAGVQHTF
mmetsp:Transcript_3996/g.12089  ORF Transcript_3996/g.12089 Transcript_3996/m.12089 type:complete len:551 (+) Transcript_3996:487-2139(+)